MIITKQKDSKDILRMLKKSKKVFLLGCAQCATVCKTGGEQEVNDMEGFLKRSGKKVTGKIILDPACHLVKVKQAFVKNKKDILASDAVLSMACGDGAQVIMDGFKGKEVFPALDTLFLGEIERGGHFTQKCVLCGECIIDSTGGLCPLTVCTKGLLNGPCGGSKNEKCEVDKDRDCGWILIYKRLKETGNLKNMKRFIKPQDHSKQIKPQKVIIE
jgi:ferredoxin